MLDINCMSGVFPWSQTGATHYHAQLGLSDKGCAIRGIGCLQYLGSPKRPGPKLLTTILLGRNNRRERSR